MGRGSGPHRTRLRGGNRLRRKLQNLWQADQNRTGATERAIVRRRGASHAPIRGRQRPRLRWLIEPLAEAGRDLLLRRNRRSEAKVHQVNISSSFGNYGKLHFEGDRKVHVLRVRRGRPKIDYRFNLNFNTAMAASRPHGIAIK